MERCPLRALKPSSSSLESAQPAFCCLRFARWMQSPTYLSSLRNVLMSSESMSIYQSPH